MMDLNVVWLLGYSQRTGKARKCQSIAAGELNQTRSCPRRTFGDAYVSLYREYTYKRAADYLVTYPS